jgi:GTP-binding protein HflX
LDNLENAVGISALTGLGIEDLLTSIEQNLFENYVSMDIFLPFKEGKLISMFHEHGLIDRIEHIDGGVNIEGKLPGRYISSYSSYVVNQHNGVEEYE